jgi:hypothetical protein
MRSGAGLDFRASWSDPRHHGNVNPRPGTASPAARLLVLGWITTNMSQED